MSDHDAFEEGYDDYWDGLAREDNPYEAEKEPEKHRSWEEGWLAAQKHDYDESEEYREQGVSQTAPTASLMFGLGYPVVPG